MQGGKLLRIADWEGLASKAPLTVGFHTLRIVIDPEDLVWEENEDDNVFEKTFVWSSGEIVEPEPIEYVDEELDGLLSALEGLLDLKGPALNGEGVDHTDQIMDIAEAGYYLATETGLQDERVDFYLLTHDGYIDWIDDNFAGRFAVQQESQYESLLKSRERFKKFGGFKTRRFGNVAIVIDAERDVSEVLSTLAHELGHLRQDSISPSLTEIQQIYEINAVQEAQAQQFERAFWKSIEEHTGLTLLQYPDYPGFNNLIDSTVEGWVQGSRNDEHLMGFLLQWLALLDDPELFALRSELESTGELQASSAIQFFEYLVDLSPGVLGTYVEDRMSALNAHLDTIKTLSNGRLVSGLAGDDEGSSALSIPGLLTP